MPFEVSTRSTTQKGLASTMVDLLCPVTRNGAPLFSQTTCSDSFLSHGEAWVWLEIREFENKRQDS